MPTPERLRELADAVEPRAGLVGALFALAGQDATEVLFIRHAQITESLGADDHPLTELGIEQAEVLAEHLAASPIAAVYASPTLRTRQTAEAIARHHGLALELRDELRDAGMRLEGDVESALQRFAATRRFSAAGSDSETGEAVSKRASLVVEEAIERFPGQRIVLVTHGPVIMSYFSSLARSETDMIVAPRLTSISVVLARGPHRTIHLLNATPHLGVL